MEKPLIFKEIPVINAHNSNTSVNKVEVYRTNPAGQTLYERSYYVKYADNGRSNNMGDIEYEARGYEIMNFFGVNTPDYELGTLNNRAVLITSPVTGNSLQTETDSSKFEQGIDDVLQQNFSMWINSVNLMSSSPEFFGGIKRLCPVTEAIDTVRKILPHIEHPDISYQSNVPKGYTRLMDTVIDRLEKQATVIDTNSPYFFQHGDELLSNFIFDPSKNQMAAIDPSPRITTGMERGLNKMLGGSMIFNLDIDLDGQPREQERFRALIMAIKRYDDLIGDYYNDASVGQVSSLREILFVNLSRIYFGIYNKENAGYVDGEDKSKYLKAAISLYDLFS